MVVAVAARESDDGGDGGRASDRSWAWLCSTGVALSLSVSPKLSPKLPTRAYKQGVLLYDREPTKAAKDSARRGDEHGEGERGDETGDGARDIGAWMES